jgi:hypothetical protein
MFGSNFVEIGIGLSLLFVLLSLMCSHAAETISRRLSWRSRFLKEGIRELLQDAALTDRVYRHPLIKGLGRRRPFKPNSLLERAARALSLQRRMEREIDVWSKPSYIPSHLFARALLDTILLSRRFPPCGALCKAMRERERKEEAQALQRLAARIEAAILDEPELFATRLAGVGENIDRLELSGDEKQALLKLVEAAKEAGSTAGDPETPLDQLRAAIERLENAELRRALRVLVNDIEVKDITEARAAVARWFDDGMDRVSGWYKRWSQRVVLGLAAFLTIALNIDTLLIADRLSRDATLRELVVAAGAGAGDQYKDLRPSNEFRPPAAQAPTPGTATTNSTGDDPNSPAPAAPPAAPASPAAPDPADTLGGSVARYQKLKAEIAQLRLPIGWPTKEEIAIAEKQKVERDRAAETAVLRETDAAKRAEAAAKVVEELRNAAKEAAPGPNPNAASKVDFTTAAAQAAQARLEAEAARAEASKARDEATLAAREAANERAFPKDWTSRLTRVLGWLFTVLAASLGAQFWFDVLGKIVNLRMSGKRPEKAPPPPAR